MTKNSIAYNRTLFLEDNLPVLRGLDSDSIDLIATDPPFNKGVPAFKGKTQAGQNVEFKDVWNWNDDVRPDWVDSIEKDHPSLRAAIDAVNRLAGDDMGAFICWMSARMLEMRRVLKPTGSIYLHCDPTAAHYLKAMMDGIFGRQNFRNEIVWRKYAGRKNNAKRKFTTQHDIIFFYGKSPDASFNGVMLPHSKKEIEKEYKYVDENGRRYRKSRGRLYQMKGIEKRIYLDESPGRAAGSLWVEDGLQLNTSSSERTGYPTQKPLALYKRMLEASSNPGDMVLDPFAGCATTCVAAEQLGRQWIGIDIREESGGVIRERLEREVSENMAWDDIVQTPTEAPERTDDGEPVAPELMLVSPKPTARRIPIREVREQLIARDGQRCQGCGWEPEYADYLQVDHKMPRTLGGKDEMENYALLCDPCNRKKSNMMTLSELRRARLDEGRIDAKWYAERAMGETWADGRGLARGGEVEMSWVRARNA